jgi:hypothetical protein
MGVPLPFSRTTVEMNASEMTDVLDKIDSSKSADQAAGMEIGRTGVRNHIRFELTSSGSVP